MGISRDQYINKGNPDNIRVYYLNPSTYGGRYVNPPLYVKPLKNEGWLGMVDVLLPEFTPCKPRSADLVNFEDIQKEISRTYNNIPEDPRLQSAQECAEEPPYNRILERASAAGIQGIIRAACRIYASAHFFKSLATFMTFYPKFPQNYSSIYAQYVVENMEASFKDSQGAAWESFIPFKNVEFWYSFLEQVVQTYSRLVDDGQIEPPQHVLDALFRLNDGLEAFEYKFKEDKREARKAGEISRFRTLKDYRKELNLEHVQQYEEDAKIVMKEFVITELNYLGDSFIQNLKEAGVSVKYEDMDYYLLTKMTHGGEGLSLDGEIKEEVVGLPISGEDHFTAGGELALPDGSEYVGYYHIMSRPEDSGVGYEYMEGAYHVDDVGQRKLTVFANKVSVPIGDVQEFGIGALSDPTKKFMIEKYTSINGTKMTTSQAYSQITSNVGDKNISDIYPGTLSHVYAIDTEDIVGLSGELGVRHGLQFSILLNGTKKVVTNVELDALDVKISQFTPLQGNSKLLLCLLNHLKEDEAFRVFVDYICPIKKFLATLAIYNDLGLIPSVGEWTVADGDTEINLGNILPSQWPTFESKPGMKVTLNEENQPNYSASTPGWASYDDRQAASLFVTQWDDWDRVLLRNSKSRIKKIFETYYNSRDFNTARDSNEFKPARIVANNLREALRRPQSARLPWFKRRMLRPNVFNGRGEMCKKKD